jgi:DNA-binding MarR family transcriptional regulator
MPVTDLDVYAQIGRQLGLLLRRTERFWAGLRIEPDGPSLERGAYLLLVHLSSNRPCRLSTVAEDVCLDLSTVSRQVVALEAAGLVSRTPDPTDRRAMLIEVSAAGHEVLAHNRERWQAVLHELLADWTPDERAEFARSFARFNDALARRQDRRQQEKKR